MKHLFFILLFPLSIFACTSILVTKEASSDGSILVSHADDDEIGDQRIIYVPAKDYPAGEKRPVYLDSQSYPRIVSKSRASAYNLPNTPESKILGYIDQVEHTYSYYDGNYGIINEHQLSIGETTCGSKYFWPAKEKRRIFNTGELSRIALERCKKAKEAVLLMGTLIEEYGFYDIGETLLVADTEEGWVMEMCGTPSGIGAMWVAKKVPEGEVFVSANQFRIREITPDAPDILFSKNLFAIAQKEKVWNETDKKPLDWLRLASFGEYNHPYYSLRRVWRVQSLINPTLEKSPWVKNAFTKEYPFSIPPAKKISVQDLIAIHRDHYEGTEFDMTKGLAAGPFNSPTRYFGPYDSHDYPPVPIGKVLEGAWERPISSYYCGYCYINQSRKKMPNVVGGVTWIAMDEPANSVFIPFYIGSRSIPTSYSITNSQNLSFKSAWWVFNFVSNWMQLGYEKMLPDMRKRQKAIESFLFKNQSSIEEKALEYANSNRYPQAKELLANYSEKQAKQIHHIWWSLAKDLIEKHADGFINKPTCGSFVGYPKKWRDEVGYKKGPTKYKKSFFHFW
ncbi:MAG TPA: C69 family dipeptidase [Chlamydiales bacterium]|nr:C69 family dipeptidase [Chlamydiales bacterium]